MRTAASFYGSSATIEQLLCSELKTTSGSTIELTAWTEDAQSSAIIIGESEPDPIETAKKLHMKNRVAPILILCEPDKTEAFKNQLMITHNIGLNTMALPNDNVENISSLLSKYVDLGVTRQQHKNRISKAQKSLESSDKYSPNTPLELSQLLEQLPIGIMVFGREFRLLDINPVGERMLYTNSAQALGQPIDSLLPPKNAAAAKSLIDRALQSGDSCSHKLRFLHQGKSLHYELIACRADNGRPDRGALVMIKDITQESLAEIARQDYQASLTHTNAKLEQQISERVNELKASKIILEKNNRELKRSNEDLEKFSFVAAHDLSEPVRKISVFADILRKKSEDVLDEESLKYLTGIQNASHKIRTLIKSLFDYSRLNADLINPESVDLNQAVESACDNLEILIKETGSTIKAEKLPTIEVDPVQVEELFQNLIANAINFRRNGVAASVNIRCKSDSEDPICEISVEDNGQGFEQSLKDKIFKPFERLHRDDKKRGSGIGLAICHQICVHHGGTITADSRLEVGTTIKIRLPRTQPKTKIKSNAVTSTAQ